MTEPKLSVIKQGDIIVVSWPADSPVLTKRYVAVFVDAVTMKATMQEFDEVPPIDFPESEEGENND